jgi:hypothetical protein
LHGFVVGAVASEVGSTYEAVLDEHVEGAVDGGRVEVRDPVADAVADLLGAEVCVGVLGEDVPDRRALGGEAAPTDAEHADRRLRMDVVACVVARAMIVGR